MLRAVAIEEGRERGRRGKQEGRGKRQRRRDKRERREGEAVFETGQRTGKEQVQI
jgi:hypothetical protein